MFTIPPTLRFPRSVFLIVSSINSKLHLFFEIFVTLRQTPFNATLCPIFNPLECFPKSTINCKALRFVVFLLILMTFPIPSIIPVNNPYLDINYV